jgi:hypothetical protein
MELVNLINLRSGKLKSQKNNQMTNLFSILAETMAGVNYPICPLCFTNRDSHSDNIKICRRHQEELLEKEEFRNDMEVKLVKQYCNN